MRRLFPILMLLLVCLWPLGGSSFPTYGNPGGYQTLNGVDAGGALLEEGVGILYDLKRIMYPSNAGGFTTIYVSSQAGGDLPVGVDTNPGTWDLPIKTLTRVQEIITERGCGMELVFDGHDVWTGATDYDDGLMGIDPTCTDTDQLAIYLHSSDPDARATFDCTGETGGNAAGVLQVDTATDAGWVVAEGIHVQNCGLDVFDTTNAAKFVVVNSGTRNVTGANNSFTAHNSSYLFGFNIYAHHDTAGATAAVIATGTSIPEILIISDKKFEISDPAASFAGAPVFVTGGFSATGVVLVGLDVGCAVGSTCTAGFDGLRSSTTAGAGTDRLTAIRTHVHDVAVCFELEANAATRNATMDLFQVTCANSTDGIDLNITNAASLGTLTAQCAVFDELTAQVLDDTNECEDSVVSITNSILDEDDIANTFVVDNTAAATVALARVELELNAGCLTADGTWNLFEDAISLAAESTGIQWDADDNNVVDASYIPQEGCNPNMECWEACDLEYTKTLGYSIPSFVLGREFSSITVGGDDQNIGAR